MAQLFIVGVVAAFFVGFFAAGFQIRRDMRDVVRMPPSAWGSLSGRRRWLGGLLTRAFGHISEKERDSLGRSLMSELEADAMRTRLAAMEEAFESCALELAELASQIEKAVDEANDPDNTTLESLRMLASITRRFAAIQCDKSRATRVLLGDLVADVIAEGSFAPGSVGLSGVLSEVVASRPILLELFRGLCEWASVGGEIAIFGTVERGMAIVTVAGGPPLSEAFESGLALEDVLEPAAAGYAVARSAVSRLGGQIWLDRSGADLRVVVAIPLVSGDATRPVLDWDHR